MSVSLTAPIDLTLYIPNPGYSDKLPIGHWKSHAVVTGDGTGGKVTIMASPVGIEGGKYLWSCEDICAAIENPGAAVYCVYCISTGEFIYPSGVLQFNFDGQIQNLINCPVSGDSWTNRRSYNSPYIHQPKQPYANAYSIHYETNLNGKVYYFDAWGYVWLPQARRLAGGPVRG